MGKVKKVNILNDLLTRSRHHGEIVEEIIEHDFTENIYETLTGRSYTDT